MTEEFVRERIATYDSSHDWWHLERVRRLALYINKQERMADPFTVEIAALLHDSADSKYVKGEAEQDYKMLGEFMDRTGLEDIKIQLLGVIRNVSFSNRKPSGNLADPVLHIIQDADKLDAIGAIGVARAFNYGGFRNQPIFDPESKSQDLTVSTSIGHFYDKLLRLKDMMNTPTGLRLAEERHKFLEIFLKQFYRELE